MGYLNTLSEAVFKEDENGNSIFYKWGVMGRGVIIDTKERREEIISFISNYYAVSFILIIFMQFLIVFLNIDIFQIAIYLIGIFLIMTLWYIKKTASLTAGLEYSPIKLSMENGWQKTAQRLPRYVIWAGFIMMLLLIAVSIGTFIFLDGSIAWASIILLITGLFGSYAYYRMIVFSKDAKPLESVEVIKTDKPSKESSEKPMEWNFKNSSIILSLLVIVIGFVYYTYADSKSDFDERMAKYDKMNTQEMASYLANVNKEPNQIDPITMHTGAKAEENLIYFYRELKSNAFSNMIVDVENIEGEKLKMSKQLKREMCDSPAFNLFYDKGGELLFVYHLVKDNEKTFLFDVKIDKIFCL